MTSLDRNLRNLRKQLENKVKDARRVAEAGARKSIEQLAVHHYEPWSVLTPEQRKLRNRPEAQALIDNELFGDAVRFEHAMRPQFVDDVIYFAGRWIVEDLSYCRAFIGKVSVEDLARLMETHGDRLLERNIRRYLGLTGNRVNEQIRRTLVDPLERPNFFFYNNGLTLVCRQFQHNAGQQLDLKVRVKGLQIINGGQTCRTIHKTLQLLPDVERTNLDQAYVLVRLYQVGDDGQSVIQSITEATNLQNPVDLRDLRSNEEVQRKLATALVELGFSYRRHRTDLPPERS